MIILDTDHFSALKYVGTPDCELLRSRMSASRAQDFAVTAITLEEQMRGWLAEIAGELNLSRQVGAYRRLVELVKFFCAWRIVPFDDAAASRCIAFKKTRIRIGTMDLKIAATAMAGDSLLLTANQGDFSKVPGLRFENWLH